jgi:hypothetical protein
MVLIPSEAIIIIILGYKDVRVLLEQCGLGGTISFAIKPSLLPLNSSVTV